MAKGEGKKVLHVSTFFVSILEVFFYRKFVLIDEYLFEGM